VIRVVVTGSECTGKTTLAEALAEHYGVPWVEEYARRFVLDKGAAPEAEDVEVMARGQISLEDTASARAGRLLIQDTDLLSTVIYSRHYYGACPEWVEVALDERLADLYLLAGIDVPWIPDGEQRDRGHMRREVQELFQRELAVRGALTVELEGNHETRLARARRVIDRKLRDS
jgi:NadR type nicotinamide-nucleotide adenylyltransferase